MGYGYTKDVDVHAHYPHDEIVQISVEDNIALNALQKMSVQIALNMTKVNKRF